MPNGGGGVDRDKGIIYGVKIIGTDSPNTHKSGAARGTKYTPSAWRSLVRILEGMNANVNHPPKNAPGEDRKAEEGLGQYHNPREEADGVYADLHCLTTHTMWPRVAEAAEKAPGNFALSINGQGRGEVIDGWYVVSEIRASLWTWCATAAVAAHSSRARRNG